MAIVPGIHMAERITTLTKGLSPGETTAGEFTVSTNSVFAGPCLEWFRLPPAVNLIAGSKGPSENETPRGMNRTVLSV